MLNPKNPENKVRTSTLETRLDLRMVAELALFYLSKHGKEIGTKSALLRTALEDYRDLLEAKAGLLRIDSTADAIRHLEELGLGHRSKGGRSSKSLFEQLAKEVGDEDVYLGTADAGAADEITKALQILAEEEEDA